MLDISQISYRVVLVQETGNQLDVSKIVENVNWEENKGELAMRINLSFINQRFQDTYISSIAKPNCMIGIFGKCGSVDEEVARGRIVDWETSASNSKNVFHVTCYDELYELQKSEDYVYYSAGISTQAAIMGIFDEWNIPMEQYNGPDVTHAKLVYSAKKLSDILLDILDDAVKKGAEQCIIRSSKGRISILPRGSNKPVYHFGGVNSIQTTNKLSTSSMITRVKVIGQGDDDEKSSVEALMDGKTEYGIRQKIVVRDKDDSMDTARSSAQEILDKDGDINRTITVQSPDIPFVRKGDLVHITAGTLDGYYLINGIRHNVNSGQMSMELESAKD